MRVLAFVMLALLTGCLSTTVIVLESDTAAPRDADGDGFTADLDCDDSMSFVNPGSVDTCNDGIDQDCDGADAACVRPWAPEDSCTADTGNDKTDLGIP